MSVHRTAETNIDIEKALSECVLVASVTTPNGTVGASVAFMFVKRFGFVGLPNAGKSSLYNALTGGGAHAAPYAFATTSPHVGVAKVPDHRLDQLAEMSKSHNVIHAAVSCTDIGGLVEGANRGEGLGNDFLGHIREVDAIVFVLRAFLEAEVPGTSDPLEQLRVVEIELALADLTGAEKALDKLRRASKGDASQRPTADSIERCISYLEQGVPLYRADLHKEERASIKQFCFLTDKPVMAVVNIGEDQIDNQDEVAAPVLAELEGAEVVTLNVQLEAETAQLGEDERPDIREALGLGDGAVSRFVSGAYHLLGLRTFLTTGVKESRAWTFQAGSTAPECASVIHTDFQRGFIRADTIAYNDLLSAGSWASARQLGRVRSEGRDYLVCDGDVMEFRFNV